MIKSYKSIQPQHINILIIGNVVAFLVAMLAIKGFISFLTKHGFKVFGYYRIIVGAIILILLATGSDLNLAR
jgi:undecaprenyl-diphosphatase